MKTDSNEFDVSSFTGGKVLEGKEEIIELAVTLAKINRLYELGEIPNRSLPALQEGQLNVIRKVLERFEEDPENLSSFEKLKEKIAECLKTCSITEI